MSLSEKLQTGLLAVLTALLVPVMILNIFGGITSGIWLAILGQWGAIFRGILAIIISGFALSFILMPSLLFAGPAMMLLEKGKKVAGMFFGFLGLSYTVAVMIGWCMWVLLIFMDMADQKSFIPMLIWSYGVALAPWFWMAEKERETNEFSSFFTFVASIAYIIVMIMFAFGASFGAVVITFGSIMVLTAILQTFVAFSIEKQQGYPTFNRGYTDDSDLYEDQDNEPGEKISAIIESAEVSYCGKCGNKLDVDSNFCAKCGAKI